MGKIVRRCPAGPEHQVITVTGGTGYRRSPCATCPWRVDAVGEFPAQAFRHSAHTAYDMAQEEFGCHESGAEKPVTCAGFLLRGSVHNLATRLRVLRGQVDLDVVSDGGVALFEGYREMAVANGVAADDPVLERCR